MPPLRHAWTCKSNITDLVMPEMGGHELAKRISTVRPEMKILYMSGYADGTIGDHGVPDPDIPYLQKPFSRVVLTRKVREVLDGARVQV